MNMSVDATLGEIKAQLTFLIKGQDEAKESRKSQYEVIEGIKDSVIRLENRVSNVEDSMAENAPTIKEFITIKHKVVGAGMMGKWLWVIGGILLGLAMSARESIIKLLGNV